MAAWLDNVRFNPTLGGTTDWTYSSAVAGYQSPASAGAVNGRAYKYFAIDTSNNWELGEGAWNSGTGVLPRTTVIANSLGTTAKINFAAAPQVAIVALKEDMISIEEANSFTATQRSQGRVNLGAAINELQNVTFAVSAAAGALTIALKDANGNDPTATTPVALTFRNASLTASPNTPTVLEVAAATSVVVPSTSTCGFSSNTAGRLWITGWNDGGTFRLGVFNASTANNIYALSENGVASSLQVVAAGNSAGQHYTAGAAVTSKAFRILGYVDWNASGMTAGTWATTNLNSIVTFGPGIRKPGDVVQGPFIGSITTTSPHNTSTTYLATNLSASIAPTSAANLVHVTAGGELRVDVANNGGQARMYRGSVSNMFGTEAFVFSSGTNATCHAALEGYDNPNAVSSTTYGVAIRSTSGGSPSISWNDNALTTQIFLREIMG
jgi:hypothetical protein